MFFRALGSAVIVILLSLFIVPTVSAHNTIPRIEISIERLHPGEVVDVRGVSFGMDDEVTLSLIGSGVEVSLGDVLANGEGDFIYIAVVPPDLAEGTYNFRAVTSHHDVLSPPLTVWGTATTEGGGQGPIDEHDGLLAPMPTYAPGVVPGGVAPVPAQPVEEPVRSGNSMGYIGLILLALGIAVLGLRVARKK